MYERLCYALWNERGRPFTSVQALVSSKPEQLAWRALRLVMAHRFALHDAVYMRLAQELVIFPGGPEYEWDPAAIEDNKLIAWLNNSSRKAHSTI